MNGYETAIIIPCKNEGIYIKQTIDFLLQTEARHISKIIVIDDNSNDHCCDFLEVYSIKYRNISLFRTNGIGAAKARNLGASLARDSQFLFFCDAHINMRKGWLSAMLRLLENSEVHAVCPGIGHFDPESATGYGQSWNEKFEIYWLKKPREISEIPLAPGGCMGIKKSVFDTVKGFDRGFDSWGYEDVEISIKLWLFGYKIYIQPTVRIGHKFRKVQPYNVNLIDFHYNKLRLAFNHFNYARIHKIVRSIEKNSSIGDVISKINSSDTYEQRACYFSQRIYDDNWLIDKFNINF